MSQHYTMASSWNRRYKCKSHQLGFQISFCLNRHLHVPFFKDGNLVENQNSISHCSFSVSYTMKKVLLLIYIEWEREWEREREWVRARASERERERMYSLFGHSEARRALLFHYLICFDIFFKMLFPPCRFFCLLCFVFFNSSIPFPSLVMC